MQEKSRYQPEKPPFKIFKLFKKLREAFGKNNNDRKEKEEADEALGIAEWALLKFTSAEIQLPERTIYENKYSKTITFQEVATKTATILRVKGDFRLVPKSIFWLILVKQPKAIYVYNISTNGTELEVLKPQVEGYKIREQRVVRGEQITEPIDIYFFLNALTDFPAHEEMASTEKIDIMFGGSPDKTSKTAKSETPEWAQDPTVPQGV